MKLIELVAKFSPGGEIRTEKDIEANQLFKGPQRQMMEIKLSRSAVLKGHRASGPISVFCLAGKGKFLAGEDLSEEQPLETGTLITLEAEIFHSAVAEPELHLLVTKFSPV